MVIWTPPAKLHLREVERHISLDSRIYAKRVVKNIVARSKELARFPQVGRMVPEFGDPSVLEVFVYSYRLMYRITPKQIDVVALIHAKRDFQPQKNN